MWGGGIRETYERASLDQLPAKPVRLASHEPHDQALTTSLDRAPGLLAMQGRLAALQAGHIVYIPI